MDTYTFATSRQIAFPVSIKINSLEGHQTSIPQSKLLRHPELRHIGSIQNANFELYVSAQLWAESKPFGVPMRTAYKSFHKGRSWNEWLELPVLIKDCPISSQIAITIWDLSPFPENQSPDHIVPFGSTTVPLFDDDGTLLKGRQKCKVYRNREADGEVPSSTPYIPRPKRRRKGQQAPGPLPEQLELERLEKLFKRHEMGEIPSNAWLDPLVFRKVTGEDKRSRGSISKTGESCSFRTAQAKEGPSERQ